MIEAKKLDGKTIWINPHQIESMEMLPDLTLTMLSGKKLIISDTPADIIERIVEYRRKIDVYKQEV